MIVALLPLILAAQAHMSDLAPGVVGLWKTARDEGLIRIEACGGAICGRIADAAPTGGGPVQMDVKNPDPTLRDRPIEGLVIMKLKPTGPGRWGEGYVYNPDDGRSYKASASLAPDGRLRVKGCLVVPLCRTQTWTRANGFAERSATTPAF
jgi:uncharacterized protein (DUF2147 family)